MSTKRRAVAAQFSILAPVMRRQLDDHDRAGPERELRQDRLPGDVAPAHRQVQVADAEGDALGVRDEARHGGRPAEGFVHVQMVGPRRERPQRLHVVNAAKSRHDVGVAEIERAADLRMIDLGDRRGEPHRVRGVALRTSTNRVSRAILTP